MEKFFLYDLYFILNAISNLHIFACLYPINVKMAEPIGPFFATHMTLAGGFRGRTNFKNLACPKMSTFITYENRMSANIFVKWRLKEKKLKA